MKNNRKIAFFIPSLRGGGAERVFVTLANEITKRGFNADLVLAQKEGPYLRDVSSKVNIVDLKSKRILFCLFPLIKYLKGEKPLSLFSTIHHINIISALAGIISMPNTKIIIRTPNYFSLSASKKELFLAKFFYKRANKIIAISEGVKKDLASSLKLSPNKIITIYNPIDISSVLEKSKENSSHKWFKNKETKALLGVGRLTEQKDFSTLIQAFAIVKSHNSSVKLIILGEGKERENLKNLIRELRLENDVDIPGFVNNPYSYMANSDIFVLSSKYEGFGNVLVEAMACGTPVVSTDCPSGPSEILNNGKYGKLVPVEDVNALAEAIEETLENPIEKEILQERAKYFSVEKAVNEYLKLINE
jgi:glycosyltransferase involved in cell wall biosynthesis